MSRAPRLHLALLAVAIGLLACQAGPARGLALVGVTVLGASGTDLEGALIVIEGDRIASVGPQTHVSLPKGLRLVDAQGAFALPSLDPATLAAVTSPGSAHDSPAARLARVLSEAHAAGRGIVPGGPADLILVTGDPRQDPRRLLQPRAVVSGGRLVENASPPATSP